VEIDKGQAGTFRVLVSLAGPALLAIVVYSAAQDSWQIFAVAVLLAACAFALGSLLGFLFGIPQYLAKEKSTDADRATYLPNTNLTQISDWLTKIIIGVGLVQFSQLTSTIGDLGDELASSLGGEPTGKPFAIAAVVGFFVIGFLVGYLYTRLRLQAAFALADRGAFEKVVDARLEKQSKADAKAVALASQQLSPSAEPPPPEKLKSALADASPATKAQVLSQAQKTEKPTAQPAPERARVVIEAIDDSDGEG
jgi:MFS family permease